MPQRHRTVLQGTAGYQRRDDTAPGQVPAASILWCSGAGGDRTEKPNPKPSDGGKIQAETSHRAVAKPLLSATYFCAP